MLSDTDVEVQRFPMNVEKPGLKTFDAMIPILYAYVLITTSQSAHEWSRNSGSTS
jgi:hypothetical protein